MPASATPEALDGGPPADAAAGFGVYVHWPFCKAKCPYCDFNSHVRRQAPDQRRYAAALVRELDWFAVRTPGATVSSVFFGGGTPSLMEPETVAAVLRGIAGRWPMAPDAEITLEANPTSVEAGRFAGYAAAGVNRVSLGVQSLRDAALGALGRQHTAAEALAAFDVARRRFDRVSFDLIYARPGQGVADWREELGQALSVAVDHLSLYQLTIEPGTAYFDLHRRGRLDMPDDGHAASLYETTQEICGMSGLPAYEISNHARPGAECRHNLVYWRGGTWAGVGPGAHGRIGDALASPRLGTSTERDPERWLARVEGTGSGIVETETLGASQAADELLIMGLRLREGVPMAALDRLGRGVEPAVLARLQAEKLVHADPHRIRLTRRGRLFTNGIAADLAR